MKYEYVWSTYKNIILHSHSLTTHIPTIDILYTARAGVLRINLRLFLHSCKESFCAFISFIYMHLFLTFSAALGIARKSSALRSLARKLAAARHSPSKLGLCARLAQTFIFMHLFLTFSLRFSATQPKVHVNE